MIPIRDANPPLASPVVTIAIIAVATFVWIFVQPKDPQGDIEFAYENAAVACELTTFEPLTIDEITADACVDDSALGLFSEKSLAMSVLVSMFLHGGLLHLGGNMWSLWIFGNNVEDAFGRIGYIVMYLASGVAATAGFVLANPTATVPLVGASGAIAGVMGAYLVLFPKAKVVSVFPVLFFIPIALPAVMFLLIWLGSQFALSSADSGIAWEAHVAGFVFGALVALVFRKPLLARVRAHHRLPERQR